MPIIIDIYQPFIRNYYRRKQVLLFRSVLQREACFIIGGTPETSGCRHGCCRHYRFLDRRVPR